MEEEKGSVWPHARVHDIAVFLVKLKQKRQGSVTKSPDQPKTQPISRARRSFCGPPIISGGRHVDGFVAHCFSPSFCMAFPASANPGSRTVSQRKQCSWPRSTFGANIREIHNERRCL